MTERRALRRAQLRNRTLRNWTNTGLKRKAALLEEMVEENSSENGTELSELFNSTDLARMRNGSLPSLKAARKVRYLVIAPSLPSLKAARKALLKNF